MKIALHKRKYGDPFEPGNDMGPIVNKAQLKKIDEAVKGGAAAGCELLLGGAIDENKPGYHYLPTLLANCSRQSAIMHQEILGPCFQLRRLPIWMKRLKWQTNADMVSRPQSSQGA
jgi:lactaldehyde dehydrogenase / glycolaldehyde dehydrogenase